MKKNLQKKNNKENRNLIIRLCVFTVLFAICVCTFLFNSSLERWVNSVYSGAYKLPSAELKVHFIDVGQGDATLFEFPDGKVMLVDAGPSSKNSKLLGYLNEVVFLHRTDRVIDFFVITHQDEDHIGGGEMIFDNFDVTYFYRPNVYTTEEILKNNLNVPSKNVCNESAYVNIIKKASNEPTLKDYFVHAVSSLVPRTQNNEGYLISMLAPVFNTYSESNNYSCALKISYNGKSFLLIGDADSSSEKDMIQIHANELQADVLKLGHHGSGYSSCLEFLQTVEPDYAVISAGKDNNYNHPNFETIERISGFVNEQNIYRTDNSGTIIFGIEKKAFSDFDITCIKNSFYFHIYWWYIVIILIIILIVIIFPKRIVKLYINKFKKHR